MNVCKESTSAVEGVCKELMGLPNATLGQALNALHAKKAFAPRSQRRNPISIRGHQTIGGIRHSIKDADKVERADAQYMLVTCSAFVNYLFTR